MVNVFGLDVTEGEAFAKSPGNVFIMNRSAAVREAELEEYRARVKYHERKSELPPLAGLAKVVCGASWIVVGSTIVNHILRGRDLSAAYSSIPWFFWLGGICFVLWLVLFRWEKYRAKNAMESAGVQALIRDAAIIKKGADGKPVIPSGAKEMDVFSERYVMQGDRPVREPVDGVNEFFNLPLVAYVQNGCLHLSDGVTVWKIPCGALRSMKRTEQMCSFAKWNKPIPYNCDRYRRYQITANESGSLSVHCWKVEITNMKGDFYLLVPDYDAETFTQLTGLTPETDAEEAGYSMM